MFSKSKDLKWWIAVFLIPIIYFIFVVRNQQIDISKLNNEKICKLPKDQTNICSSLKAKCNSDYFKIAIGYYCNESYPNIGLKIGYSFVILNVLAILIIFLSVVVSNYLIDNINHLTKLLEINNQILSLIIIPLTNCLPDLVNYNIALRSNSIDLVIGQLIGTNLITFTLIIGLISYVKPFSIEKHKFILFNFGWVLIIMIFLIYILSDSKITKTECFMMSGVFLVYISYLIWYDQRLIDESIEEEEILSVSSSKNSINIEETMALLNEEEVSYEAALDEDDDNASDTAKNEHSITHYIQFFFNSIDFLFFFVIPSNGHQHNQEYKKTIRKFHIFNIWLIIESIMLINHQFINDLRIGILIMIGIIILYEINHHFNITLNKIDELCINSLGVMNSLVIISNISSEFLKILKNYGIIIQISEYRLGLLIFSLVNSINDVIMNLSLSINISPILGINACLGAPLLNILVGIGINGLSTLIIYQSKSLKFHLSNDLIISTMILTMMIGFYLIYIPLNTWKFDKKIGIIACFIWISIAIYNFILEQ